ncbi:MAG: hypothetical protein II261_07860 [Bacteroidaceae bacterium]|nr:hypothetical protein [Bacteroidaceae bacterium]
MEDKKQSRSRQGERWTLSAKVRRSMSHVAWQKRRKYATAKAGLSARSSAMDVDLGEALKRMSNSTYSANRYMYNLNCFEINENQLHQLQFRHRRVPDDHAPIAEAY